MKITIPKPCHENWDAMTHEEKGRFCAVCSKTVFDFTQCSDEEIITSFSNSKEEICGNFNESQLNRNFNFSFINSLLTKFAVGFVLTSGGFVSIKAQEHCDTKKSDSVRILKGKPLVKNDLNAENNNKTETSVYRRGAISTINEDSQPLYILDGIIISPEELKKIDPKNFDSVNVLKGSSATTIYGEKARYGAIVITSKKRKNKK